MKYIIPYQLFEAEQLKTDIFKPSNRTPQSAEEKWNRYKKAAQPYLDYFFASKLGMWYMEYGADIDEKDEYIKKYMDDETDQLFYLLTNDETYYSFKIYVTENKLSVVMHTTGDIRINGKVLSDGQKRHYLVQKIFNIEYEYPEMSLFNLFNKSKEDGFSVKLEVCPDVNAANLLPNEINCKTVIEDYFPGILCAHYNETNYGLMQYFVHYSNEVAIKDWWRIAMKYAEPYRLFSILSNSPICGDKFKKIIGDDAYSGDMYRMGFDD